jgi:Fic family protein
LRRLKNLFAARFAANKGLRRLTTSSYAKLAKCSSDTALRDIRELVARGILLQNPSGGRSTSYHLAEPDDITT